MREVGGGAGGEVCLSAVAERYEEAGRWERLAYDRAVRDRRGLEGYVWDEGAADRAVRVISLIRHTKGRWAGERWGWVGWQEWVVRELFGWQRRDGGGRRYRWAYIEVPRKNGKSELAAAVSLCLLVADGEQGAEVYAAATKRDQARIVFGAAAEMVRRTPELRSRVVSYRGELRYPPTAAVMAPLGADADTLDGLSPHGVVVDELHAHRDRRVLDVLQTATGARRQPLGLVITTAGVYDPESVGWQMHQYARGVLEGSIQDESMLVFLSSADDGLSYDDPVAWRQANPSLGRTIEEGYLREQAERAAAQPSYRATVERYHLNRWVQVADTWLDMDRWRALPARAPESRLAGRVAYAGLDLSSRIDLTALVLVLPEEGSDAVDVVTRYWVPEETVLRRSREDRVPYDRWVREGWLRATPGDVVDYGAVRGEILGLAQRYDVVEWAYDEWGAMQLALELQAEGLTMVPMRQGYRSLSEPTKEVERLVAGGWLRHGGDPVLTWMASRCAVSMDPAGNVKPDRKRSHDRIDGVVALVMAVGRMILRDRGPRGSVYERRGLRMLG